MATVERVTGPSVGLTSLPSVRATSQMDVSGRSAVASGLADVAQEAHKIYEVKQEQADTAQLLQARNQLGDWERQWFDPANPDGVQSHRGLDALKLHDKIEPDFEKAANEAGAGIHSPRARRLFEQMASERRESVLNRVSTYATNEHDQYVAATTKAAILQSVDRGAAAALDGRIDDQVRAGQELHNTILASARLQGFAEDSPVVQQQLRSAFSSMHSTAVNGMIARGDIDTASTYFHDNAGDMTAEDTGHVIALLRPAMVDRAAEAAADALDRGVLPGASGSDVGLEQIFPAQFHQESGGQQFNADGTVKTSPKGAVGIAQVMPDTGPTAAAYAGVPWDPERFKSDRDYNMVLGKAYMQAMTEQFGSVPLGLAAYNAGPGAVQKWIATLGDPRKGQISVADFVERIPYDETKGYVRAIMKRAGAPLATQTRVPAGDFAAKMEAADAIADKDIRTAVKARLRESHSLAESMRVESERSTTESINTAIEQAPRGAPLQQVLTPDQLAFATQQGMMGSLRDRLRQRAADEVTQTDPAVYDDLHRMVVDHPNDFMKLNLATPGYYDRLDANDYQTLRTLQATLKDPKKRGPAIADWATDAQRVDSALRNLGLATDKTNAKRDRTAAFSDAMRQSERAFVERTGKSPLPAEKDELVRQVTKSWADRIAAGKDPVKQAPGYEAFNITLTDSSRAGVRSRLRQRLGREPTEAEVIFDASAIELKKQKEAAK
jgi:hypothetical protein